MIATVAAGVFALNILLLLSFQVLNRDYGLYAHAVSDYGVGKTAGLFRAYVIVGSLSAPLLAVLFWQSRDPVYPAAIPVYLGLLMMAQIVLGLYPNDLRGTPRTRAGKVHHVATLVAFTCAYLTIADATPLLVATSLMGEVLNWVKHCFSLGFFAVMLTISPPLRRWFGLAERLFLYSCAVWFLCVSLSFDGL
ncbi:MAG: DUF998 domain-containing protein [Candidatus Saccharibacteria bacterium]|nr:DUF998 domain-containing protein [Pseudorhodobacter sp.]